MWGVVTFYMFALIGGIGGDLEQDSRYELGKAKYEAITKETRMPRYSQCWTDALAHLQQGCKQLTDDIQYRMALNFANCHLEKTGRTTYPCGQDQELKECLQHMDHDAYQVHAEFVTHTQNICFFLESQVWHDKTESTIHRLADNSATVAQQMEDSSQLQTELLKRQNDSIENQQLLLERGNELKKSLEQSSIDVHKMLVEFKETTSEQRAMIFEVFDRLTSLQKVVMGEFTGFYSLIFYTASILISYIVTSTPRTGGARFWLFLVMTGNILCERLIVYVGAQDDALMKGQVVDSSAIIYGRLWLCRKTFCTAAVIVWLYVAYRFQDLNRINNTLLCEIKKQNSELKHLLQNYQPATPGSQFSLDRIDGLVKPALTNGAVQCTEELAIQSVHSTTEGYVSGSESDSSSSTDSGLTDHTFHMEDHSDHESVASFLTTGSSRMSRENTPALLDELHDLRQATPLREMTPFMEGNTPGVPQPSTSSTPMRPPASRRRLPRPPPIKQVRYNLRQRNSPQYNPVVDRESARDFSHAVKHLADVALWNTQKTHYTIHRVVDSAEESS